MPHPLEALLGDVGPQIMEAMHEQKVNADYRLYAVRQVAQIAADHGPENVIRTAVGGILWFLADVEAQAANTEIKYEEGKRFGILRKIKGEQLAFLKDVGSGLVRKFATDCDDLAAKLNRDMEEAWKTYKAKN